MVTAREIRFGLFLLVGFVVLLFVACGHSPKPTGVAAGAGAQPSVGVIAPTLPPVPPPTTPLAVPNYGGPVGQPGQTDQQVVITPTTYQSSGDPCAYLATAVAITSAPQGCQQEWKALGATSVPGADLMNTTAIPHVAYAGPGVSQTEAAAAATAFYRWQAFQTWAENNTLVPVMEALDPPGHQDPVVQALLGGGQGAQVMSVDPCNLPVQLRVVHLDSGALAYLNAHGWSTGGDLAVLATYPECSGIMVVYADHGTKNVADSGGAGVTAINPGSIVDLAPFGHVWRISGEASCGDDPALATVCGGGS